MRSETEAKMRTTAPREEVREALLDATDRLLARYGYKKMTIDDLAHEVGIGKGTVYLHFSSKEDVALSHIDRIIERLKERLNSIAAEDALPADRLRRMLIERVLFRFDSVQHYTQSLNDLLAALRPRLLARRQRYFTEEALIFAAVLAEGKRLKMFDVANETDTAELFLTATNSLLPYSLSTRELGERADIEEKASRLADLLLAGVRKQG
jgi:AcrR family transcriptional regulator